MNSPNTAVVGGDSPQMSDVVSAAVRASGGDRRGVWRRLSHLRVVGCRLRRLRRTDLLYVVSSVNPDLRSLAVSNGEVGDDGDEGEEELSLDPAAFSVSPSPSHLHTLDLSSNPGGVRPLPRGLLCPLRSSLVTLNLSSSGLRSASDAGLSADCPQSRLRRLDLSGNSLSRLPRHALSSAAAVPALEELDLSRNRLALVDDAALDGLGGRLKVLDLSHNGLSSLPVALFGAGDDRPPLALRELYLGNNSLSGLPAGLLDRLSHLSVLNLSGNAVSNSWLSTRLSAFRRLRHLAALDLSGNRLTFLPASALEGLSSLQVLTLARNRLSALAPDALLPVSGSLRALSLSHNQLEELPEGGLRGMGRLASLSLDHNRIASLHGYDFRQETRRF